MKTFPQGIDAGPEIEPMQLIGTGTAKAAAEIQEGIRRSHLHILPMLFLPKRLDVGTQRLELIGIFDQRFAMIGKR